MDTIRGQDAAGQFFGMMSLERSTGGKAKARTFPTPADVAAPRFRSHARPDGAQGSPFDVSVAVAQAGAKAAGADDRLTIIRLNRKEPAAMEAALDAYTEDRAAIDGAIFLPVPGPGDLSGAPVDASDDVVRFIDGELPAASRSPARRAATGSGRTRRCRNRDSCSRAIRATAR